MTIRQWFVALQSDEKKTWAVYKIVERVSALQFSIHGHINYFGLEGLQSISIFPNSYFELGTTNCEMSFWKESSRVSTQKPSTDIHKNTEKEWKREFSICRVLFVSFAISNAYITLNGCNLSPPLFVEFAHCFFHGICVRVFMPFSEFSPFADVDWSMPNPTKQLLFEHLKTTIHTTTPEK